MRNPMTPEILRAAARRPDAPPRLRRAADAVAAGTFTWADVASGTCAHPSALALFSEKAYETLWPVLSAVADELDAPKAAAPVRAETVDDDSYYAEFSVLPNLWAR